MHLPKVGFPTFEVAIPSTKEVIKMRPMLVKEEKILLMAREGEERQEIISAIKQVVNNCLVVPSPKIDTLTMFDIEYLFLKLRAQSISNETKVSYKDNEDGKVRTFDIDLNNVVVKFPEHDDKDIKVSDAVTIVMRYPPASLYSNKEFLDSTGDKLLDMLIQESIDKIYDGKIVIDVANPKPGMAMSRAELAVWLDNLDLRVYGKIREFLSDLPTLFYEIKYTNDNGKERTIELRTLNDFFMLA